LPVWQSANVCTPTFYSSKFKKKTEHALSMPGQLVSINGYRRRNS
jgi:hypothetical protein